MPVLSFPTYGLAFFVNFTFVKRFSVILVLMVLLAILQGSFAQAQGYRDNTKYDNLSHLCVRAFAQDSLGNMWIGTLAGLDKYNGYEFEYFKHDPADTCSIRNDFVFSLLMDGDNLLVGTAMGVDCLNVRLGRISRIPGPTCPVYQLFKDHTGAVRIASVEGLGLLDKVSGQISYRNDWGEINRIWEDSYGRLWLGTPTGLALEDGNARYSLPGERQVFCCHPISEDLWWLGTDKGIVLFNPVTGSSSMPDNLIPASSPLQKGRINFISEVAPSKLLIGTAIAGVWQYDLISHSLENCHSDRFNPNDVSEITCCYRDFQGNTWIGSYEKGFVIAGKQSDYFNENTDLTKPLANKFVTRVVEDERGSLWIADRYGYLYSYSRPEGFRNIDLSGFKPAGGDYLECLFIDSRGRFWLAFEKSLCLAAVRGGRAFKLASFPLDHVRSIREDNDGTVWLGAWSGLYKYTTRDSEPQKIDINPALNITDILPMDNGEIWFSSHGWSVFKMKDDIIDGLALPDEGLDVGRYCITMKRDSKNRIWLGSYGYGLLCLDGDKVVKINEEDGLPDSNVLSFQEDLSGNIWVSTFHGIARIDLPKGDSSAMILTFPGRQYHEKSGCRTASGQVYFGGNHGLTFFDPKSFSAGHPAPTIHLEDLKIWGQSVRPGDANSVLKLDIAYTDRISLNHKQRSFSLDFAGNDFFSSNNLTYKYRLAGFDKDWVDAGTYRRASYSNLQPGDYTFEAVAIGEDGTQSPLPARLKIHIKQLPWFSWWALLAYFLLIFAIAWVLIRSAMHARLAREHAEMERKEKEREKEMSQMKTIFFTNISHELRTPLTLISAPLEKLLAKPSLDTETTSLLEGIHRNSSRMLMLINQLMDFTKIENGVYFLGVRYTDIMAILKETVSSFSFLAEKQGLKLLFTPHDASQMIWADEDKIVKIMDNLLSNAIKHTPQGGTIEVTTALLKEAPQYGLEADEGYLEVSVLDTGCGVPADQLDQLFVRYRQLDGSEGRRPDYSGNGIGLHYTQNMVEKHHGKIVANLRPAGGMDFSFVLPLRDVYSGSEKVIGNLSASSAAEPAAVNIPSEKPEAHTLMVVEDNAELREFLVGLLGSDYKVLQAPDGDKAWDSLTRNHTDLVVSDVIMPGISGYELCAKIKQSPSLCHLPVVLLTAKTSHQEQMEGLENGADAYICKPFHADLLMMTIRNLLRAKDVMRQYFSQPGISRENIIEVDMPASDKPFLDKLTAIMAANLSNPELNIDSLAREMGYSRTAFYLKVKRLTSTAPNDLVRNYRFKAAAEAIRSSQESLSDIAEHTGFGSYSYFSKAFKKHFGVSPKEYRTKD